MLSVKIDNEFNIFQYVHDTCTPTDLILKDKIVVFCEILYRKIK